MANVQKLESTLEQLQSLIGKLKTGELQLAELETLVEQSRELYEWSTVLRYKAYEMKSSSQVEVQSVETREELFEVEQSTSLEKDISINLTSDEVFQPAMEFDLFVEPSQESEVEVVEVSKVTQEPIALDESSEQEDFRELADTDVSSAEVVLPVSEPAFQPELEKDTLEPSTGSDDFLKRFSSIDPSLQSQMAMARLDTLIGSFGLNERLQFINELFDGSSEAFSDAIKAIDSQSDEMAAMRKASLLAAQFNWDKESETVEEFVMKIKRRYA